MAYDRTQEAKEVAVAVLIVALVGWIAYHYLTPKATTQPTAPIEVYVPPENSTAVIPLSNATPAQTGNETSCSCQTCSASSSDTATLASIEAQTLAYTNAIIAAGNATLQAIANIANESDPLLNVTVN